MKETIDKRVPRYKELISPTFQALKKIGGSGKNTEILSQIILDLKIPNDISSIYHKGNPNKTELSYQADWARTYLRLYGVIENIARSTWSITRDYANVETVDGSYVFDAVNKMIKTHRTKMIAKDYEDINDDSCNEDIESHKKNISWRENLSGILQKMEPLSFERLVQRFFSECGFTEVRITKKSRNGEIGGTGRLLINGIFSFNVAFQCNRISGLVGASEIREFRGSLTTDVEKGIYITTGVFSKEAKEEASNPGRLQINLIDGEDFITKLAEHGIGLKPIVTYEIDKDYFNKL